MGFYWTLPVTWAGFTELPKDPNAAAAKSWTIDYQRERVKRWVASECGRLVDEVVFMEARQDRGTEYIIPGLERSAKICMEQGATLVYVNFRKIKGSRSHQFMSEWIDGYQFPNGETMRAIGLDPIAMEVRGKLFDPIKHFRAWRKLGRVDGFDQDEAQSERDEGAVVLVRLLAA